MLCSQGCKSGTKVLRTSDTGTEVRRQRQCSNCGARFWTVEMREVAEQREPMNAPPKQPRRRTLAEEELEMMRDLVEEHGWF